MKYIISFILIVTTLILNAQINCDKCKCCNNCRVFEHNPGYSKTCNYNPWILAFEDNFDGNQIDLSKWDVKESVIRGFSNPTAWMSSNNVEVSNGTLKLIATQNTPPLQGTYVASDSSLSNKNPSYETNLYLNKTTLSQSGVINKYGFGASLLYLLYKKQFFNFFFRHRIQ
ncbi:MAG TPA: hypothetical protein VKZ45_09115 [Vicingaceae bacterium]|nr:hypothetical protein [Vicingaceae bacterium]